MDKGYGYESLKLLGSEHIADASGLTRKYMKIVLASNNQGKLAELQAMLTPLGCVLIAQGELGVPEAPEPHRTFVENALAKARNAALYTGLPGVDTAYYATQFGYPKGDDNNVRALLEQMRNIENRRAALVSTLVAVRSADDPEPLIAVGRVVGQIAREPVGSNGFGFDPVMWIPEFGQTFAQLPIEVKNANSHRGKSARAMSALIREHWLEA